MPKSGDDTSLAIRLLTAALTEPDSTNVEELVERLRDECEGDEAVGRRWVAAARAVQQSGRLSPDEADSIVDDVANAVLSGASGSDPELGALSAKLKPLHELHHKNWEAHRAAHDQKGSGAALAEPVYPEGMRELMDRYGVRYGQLHEALLESFGENALAAEHRADDRAHLQRMIRGTQALMRRADAPPGGGWRVTFTAPEDVPLPPMVQPDVNVYATEYDEKIDARVEQWAQATGDEGSIWTVQAVLDFAALESYRNEDGDGDAWVKAVQRARAAGVLERDLSWLLLDRITDQMIPDELGDPYQADLMEKFIDVEAEYGDVDESDEESVRNAPEAWRVLQRARDRRITMLKVRVLRAAGEDEMARVMEEERADFARRMEKVAEIWDLVG